MKRRDFLKAFGLGTAAMAFPSIPTFAAAPHENATIIRKSANDKVNLAFIGLGQQGIYLLSSFIALPNVRVVCGADVYDIKRERFIQRVTEYYQGKGEKKVKVDCYEDYQQVLARKDVDAVVIATPDHQHAIIGIAAAKAGKDIYMEKPLTFTIYEGQQLVKAVRKYGVVFQTGSMQRSFAEMAYGANLLREGALGKVEKIKVYVGRNEYDKESGCPVARTLPAQECPAGLNWDKWLGPLPESVKYHHDFNPTLDEKGRDLCWGKWRWFKETGGGLMTDWGAHMFDIAQWAIGKDGSGPVKVIPAGYRQYDHLTYLYDNGIVMTEEQVTGEESGVKFYCEEGTLTLHRMKYIVDNPKFAHEFERGKFGYACTSWHHQDFIDAVRAHVDPLVSVETGHTSNIVCCLGNIANELQRPVEWNPIVQKFMNDPEAQKMTAYDYRNGYNLDID